MPTNTTQANWADVVITAVSLQEPFDMVKIIPAKTAFKQTLRQTALDKVNAVQAPMNEHTIRTVELSLVANKTVSVRESITFGDDGIEAVLNDRYSSNEEATMCRVMEMITAAIDQLPNKKGTLEFGEPIQYNLPQMPHLLRV